MRGYAPAVSTKAGTGKTADASAAELAAIEAILEPWCYVMSYGQPYMGLLTGRFAAGPYRFEVIIKPDLGKVITRGAAAGREYRTELMCRAEDALSALEAAGWQLTGYPHMEFIGEVMPFSQTLTGELVQPSQQGGMALKMRFEVNRSR